MSLAEAIQRYHEAANAFSRGDPEPVKALYAHVDDVTLANPFGPAVRGWQRVSAALDFASSRFTDGAVTSFVLLGEHVSDDLASILELENWHARVGERANSEEFELRVTSTFRLVDGSWKLVHRHADPVPRPDPYGPVRDSAAGAPDAS